MARINLLPWRQEERQRKNKEFLVVAVAAAILALLLVLMALAFLIQELSSQNNANEKIRAENALLDKDLEEIATLEQQRDDMIAKIKIIQDLQGRRSVPVRVWDDIARAIPNAMYLTAIKRQGDTIELTGLADNPNVVSQLVRNLDGSAWLADSRVPSIKTDVQAYQAPKIANTNGNQRPVYPEDSYIQFVVTTQVKFDKQNPENTESELVEQAVAVDGDVAIVADVNQTAEQPATEQQPVQSASDAPVVTEQPTPTAEQPTTEQKAGGQ